MAGHDKDEWLGDSGDRWATHLERLESMISPAGNALMDFARFGPGEAVADVGCGGGATSLEIARRVGPEGRVTGIDVSPQLIARAKARLGDAANVAFELGDAQSETPGGAPFDRIFSRFGVMFFDDTLAAFTNMRGWLKPGGGLVFGCWAGPKDNPWMGEMGAIVRDYADVPPPDLAAPGPFRLHDPEATTAMLAEAGFANPRAEMWRGEQLVGGEGADPEAATEFVFSAMGMGKPVEEQAPDKMDAARARIAEAMAPHYRDGSVRMDAACLFVTADNPG